MERRAHTRYPRRFEVRFWRQGQSEAHSGFTTNISRSGAFLGTTHMLAPGERVRVEVLDAEKGFIAEGRIVRSHRVSVALRHVDQPGIGVRFLMPDELLSDLLPAARAATTIASRVRVRGPLRDVEAEASREVDAAAPVPEIAPAAAAAPSGEPSPPPLALRVVPVDFVDRTSFLAVYHRDLSTGGLFVSTPSPAALQEVVIIELTPPLANVEPLRFEARVVHRFEPDAAVGKGRNLLSGMGVQFLEPDRVKAQLAPVLAELRK